MEGLSIKVAEADADHTVLQCTCGSKGLGKRGAERVKSDRGAHEKGVFEAGSQGWVHVVEGNGTRQLLGLRTGRAISLIIKEVLIAPSL